PGSRGRREGDLVERGWRASEQGLVARQRPLEARCRGEAYVGHLERLPDPPVGFLQKYLAAAQLLRRSCIRGGRRGEQECAEREASPEDGSADEGACALHFGTAVEDDDLRPGKPSPPLRQPAQERIHSFAFPGDFSP